MKENSENNNKNVEPIENMNKRRNWIGTIFSIGLVFGAVIMVFAFVNNRLAAGNTIAGGIWTGGRGSCCSTGNTTGNEDQLAQAGLDYYRANYGNSEGLEAIMEDFGCHQEITIYSNGEAVRKFSHSGGNFYDITP